MHFTRGLQGCDDRLVASLVGGLSGHPGEVYAMGMLSRREALACGAGLLAARSARPQPSKAPVIRTVLKDIAPESLAGATLFHEHLSLAADFMPRWISLARGQALPPAAAPTPGF